MIGSSPRSGASGRSDSGRGPSASDWHAPSAVLERYAGGTLDDLRASSVEAHLTACAACRAVLATRADRARLDRLWDEVAEAVDAPVPGPVERALLRLGVREHVARLLAATPSLRLSWLLAVAGALAFAVVAAHHPRGDALPFLLLAPLVPVVGVAVAYGPGVDPTYEVAVAAPVDSLRLLLLRAEAVLATSTLLTAVVAAALPTLGWTAAAWLVPALALTALSLALGTFVEPLVGAAGVALTWGTAVTALERLSTVHLAAFRAGGQAVLALVGLVAALVLLSRRDRVDLRRIP